MNKIEFVSYKSKLQASCDFLRKEIDPLPQVAMVIGSGLGDVLEKIEVIKQIDFAGIPAFPLSTVAGHKGQLVFGACNKQHLIVLSGRKHCYEGQSLSHVVLPVRVLGMLGIQCLVLTNAAGSLNPLIVPGDLMIITDHINMMFRNPLIGPSPMEWGSRFPDMSEPWDLQLREIAFKVGLERKIPLKQGVYVSLTGPNYETGAEVSFLRSIGADVVGMSTVPENIIANQMGMFVLGISYISNSHVMEIKSVTTHEEVIENVKLVKGKFISLMDGILGKIADLPFMEKS